jgi:DNA-binding XRE family transcriptional regulator
MEDILSNEGIEERIELSDSVDRDRLRRIMTYRALGYNQTEIADKLDISQKTVSRYLKEIKSEAERSNSPKMIFYGLFLEMITDSVMGLFTFLMDLMEENES